MTVKLCENKNVSVVHNIKSTLALNVAHTFASSFRLSNAIQTSILILDKNEPTNMMWKTIKIDDIQ